MFITRNRIVNPNAIRKNVRVVHYVDVFGESKFAPIADIKVCDRITDFRLSDIPEEAFIRKERDHAIVAPCRFYTSEGVFSYVVEFHSTTRIEQIRRGNPHCLPRWALTSVGSAA